jgi:phospholipid/cholesterol/gamma-HCH transport system permease protein
MKVLDDVGNGTIGILEYAGGVATLSLDALSYLGRFRIRFGETISQAYLLGVQSTTIVLLTSLFTGLVIAFESAQQATNYGVSSLVGGAVHDRARARTNALCRRRSRQSRCRDGR